MQRIFIRQNLNKLHWLLRFNILSYFYFFAMSSMKRRNDDIGSSNNIDKNLIFRILMYSTKEYDKLSFDAKFKELKQPEKYEIHYTHQNLSKDSVKLAHGYDCICMFVNDDGSREILEKLKQIGIKLILLRCAGFNNVDLKAAVELSIEVGYVPSYSPNAVAEHAAALVMSLNRRLHRAYDRIRNGDFRLDGLVGFDMNGKTVGILGKLSLSRLVRRIYPPFFLFRLSFVHPKVIGDETI